MSGMLGSSSLKLENTNEVLPALTLVNSTALAYERHFGSFEHYFRVPESAQRLTSPLMVEFVTKWIVDHDQRPGAVCLRSGSELHYRRGGFERDWCPTELVRRSTRFPEAVAHCGNRVPALGIKSEPAPSAALLISSYADLRVVGFHERPQEFLVPHL